MLSTDGPEWGHCMNRMRVSTPPAGISCPRPREGTSILGCATWHALCMARSSLSEELVAGLDGAIAELINA